MGRWHPGPDVRSISRADSMRGAARRLYEKSVIMAVPVLSGGIYGTIAAVTFEQPSLTLVGMAAGLTAYALDRNRSDTDRPLSFEEVVDYYGENAPTPREWRQIQRTRG